MTDTTIDLQGLVKHFDGITPVAGIDLSAQPDELFGFLGPTGAGKTASKGNYLITKPATVSMKTKEGVHISGIQTH